MKQLATLVYFAGIVVLLLLERDRKSRVSHALWLPVIWMLLAGSRSLSGWVQSGPVEADAAGQYLDGSPLDRFVLTGLLVVGLGVLWYRGPRVVKLLRANWPILLFFFYCVLSTVWSDFPDVAFKRWTKAVGDLVMVLIVVTDGNPSAAVKRFLARVGFVLLPCSVLCIKYYPEFGRTYDRWVGTMFYSGVATDKNMLGMLCLVFGIASAWRFIEESRAPNGHRRFGPIIAHGVILAVTAWLLTKANSMTSLACFGLATGLIVATSIPALRRRRVLVHLMVAAVLSLAFCALFLNLGAVLVQSLGRDPTLTGRTDLWSHLLSMNQNPLLGTGFGSFWLGARLEKLWSIYWWHPNESHNGYLEIFLNLGIVGSILLAMVLISGYRNVMNMLQRDPEGGRLRLAYFVAALAYNFTEAAFKTMNLVWIALLLAMVAVPKMARKSPVLKARREEAA